MIQGSMLAKAIISGANNISNKKQMCDELNVFPVPDGDTGTNMSMTINAGKKELALLENPTVEKAAEVAASALLRGARGNSGVILSLLFRGFSKGLKGKTEANGQDLAAALTLGVDAAYKAVMKPTEGTILTVARLAAEAATELALQTNDPQIIFDEIVTKAKEALAQTPELLPVLKKAGVVDAGGMGLVVIFEGMQSVFNKDKVIEPMSVEKPKNEVVNPVLNAVADYDGEITFGYCTEFIVDKAPNCPDPLKLRAYLESIGDSVVCVDDDDIIKIHVHTNNPGNAIQEGLKFGQLMNLKIDNMRIQHQAKVVEATYVKQGDEYAPVNPEKQFGFVAVAAGAGLQELFYDLGVDKMVSGGQTMNPSTDDILKAIMATPAETVFVLPNNKNIIMAAEQAVKLADRRVCVLQTRTIPQGISAMLAFDPEQSYSENRLAMTKQFDLVQTGLVTFAARDSDFDGHAIKKGEILGLDNGKLSFVEKELNKAIVRLTKVLTKKSSGTFITIIYGSDVSDEQAEKSLELIKDKYGDTYEINLINGGQPVYYYMISVE
ncbi:MAG: DAK2 domain-containing protein [Oscillospiraceae bacterium]